MLLSDRTFGERDADVQQRDRTFGERGADVQPRDQVMSRSLTVTGTEGVGPSLSVPSPNSQPHRRCVTASERNA